MKLFELVQKTDLQSFKKHNINILIVAEEIESVYCKTIDNINFNIEDYESIPPKWAEAEMVYQELRQRINGTLEIVYTFILY